MFWKWTSFLLLYLSSQRWLSCPKKFLQCLNARVLKLWLKCTQITLKTKMFTIPSSNKTAITSKIVLFKAYTINPSLSNTVEQIRPVNGLTRLVRSVQVVKQWFTSCTGRGTMVTCISLVRQHFNLHSTTRTGRTGRETMVYELYNWWTLYIFTY